MREPLSNNDQRRLMMKAPTAQLPLALYLTPGQGLTRNTGLCLGFSLFMALMAQISIHLPFTPVPITGQTLGVLLTGALLGPRLGFATMLVYLAEGAMGLPFFSSGRGGFAHLMGPTGGYLISFPFAALLVGWLSTRGWDRHYAWTALAMLAGSVVIFAMGASWLGIWLSLAGKYNSFEALMMMGVWPFLPGNGIKILLAITLLPSAWRLVGRQ